MALSLPSSSSFNTSNALAADARSLDRLKFAAGSSPEATREAAKQFESLFMREMIKSMREATMKSGLMDGAQGDLGTDLLDQQLAVQMSGLPGGLSDAIQRQLTAQMGAANATNTTPATAATPAVTPAPAAGTGAAASVSQTGFVQRMNAVAAKVEQSSGIPAAFMIGQAGHETGELPAQRRGPHCAD